MIDDHEYLLTVVDYNPETGIAVYKRRRQGCKIGQRVGRIQCGKRSKPYRFVEMSWLLPGKIPFSHFVHFYMTGRWPVAEMDHVHGDTLDDRWLELRESTRTQNEANRGARRNSSTGYRGVFPHGRRFRASYYRAGKRTHLGAFDSAQEAHSAYLSAVAKHDGEFLHIP